jgi:hypothetical protein
LSFLSFLSFLIGASVSFHHVISSQMKEDP